MIQSRSIFSAAVFAFVMSGFLFYGAGVNGATPKSAKQEVETVDLFKGIQDGKLEAKVIFKNRKAGTVSVENKTNKPLSVIMPKVAGATPVLAQMGGGADEGGLQSMMENMDGGGGGGGGQFMIPAEKVIRKDFQSVCLDHGKKDPNPKAEYTLKPIEEVTDRPAVIELGKMLGKVSKADLEIIQLATWMLNNDLTPADLSKETWKTANGRVMPANSPAQLQAAFNLAQLATQKAQENAVYIPPTVPSSASQN